MANLFLYCTAENYGKNFFTAEHRRNFFLRGYPADVWVVSNNEKAAIWIADRDGVTKSKADAQVLVDAIIAAEQAKYDAASEEDRQSLHSGTRAGPITLP